MVMVLNPSMKPKEVLKTINPNVSWDDIKFIKIDRCLKN